MDSKVVCKSSCYKSQMAFLHQRIARIQSTWSPTVSRETLLAKYGTCQSSRLFHSCCDKKIWLCSGACCKDNKSDSLLFPGEVEERLHLWSNWSDGFHATTFGRCGSRGGSLGSNEPPFCQIYLTYCSFVTPTWLCCACHSVSKYSLSISR